MILQGIKVQLSKVILLKDAFSEETITNGIQIIISPRGKFIIKQEYCLFLDIDQKEFEVEIISPIYQYRKILLKVDAGKDIEEIFLYPSKAYPIRSGSTSVCGIAPPNTMLWFHLEEGIEVCKLLCDYKKSDKEISIFVPGGIYNRKRNWYIWDKEDKKGEYFKAQKNSEENEIYQLLLPLGKDYRKKDTLIYPAVECLVDENGEFFLIFEQLKEQKYILFYSYFNERNQICGEIEISGLKQNLQYF